MCICLQTVNTKNRRLELRFRPDDGYCKPACGDRHQTSGFLLRIRVKKSRRAKVEDTAQSKTALQENNSSQATNSTNDVETDAMHRSANTGANAFIDLSATSGENQEDADAALEKNQPPTFDRNKYENLSEDTEYQMPKLKILGRVDTEFRFTSKCSK